MPVRPLNPRPSCFGKVSCYYLLLECGELFVLKLTDGDVMSIMIYGTRHAPHRYSADLWPALAVCSIALSRFSQGGGGGDSWHIDIAGGTGRLVVVVFFGRNTA